MPQNKRTIREVDPVVDLLTAVSRIEHALMSPALTESERMTLRIAAADVTDVAHTVDGRRG